MPINRPPTITVCTPRRLQRATPMSPSARTATATCTNILPASDPKSKVAHANIPADVWRVSRTEAGHGFQRRQLRPTFSSYEQSVHGKAVAGGSEKAAVCTDCHGEHDILGAGDPKSPVFKFNVPATCGKCHADVDQNYIAEHPRPADRAGQLAGAGLYGLSWNPHHQGANRSQVGGCLGKRGEYLRRMPRQRAALERVRPARQSGIVLPVQLSRHGIEGWLQDGRQLRQLPRGARYPALQRSPFQDQPGASGPDLRKVPSRGEPAIHHRQSSLRRNAEGGFRAPRSSASSASSTSG